ncbi:S1-like domain-containing RNA-binding protein [uncultured Thiothrix sp.]|uniref:CvfB family protein n=1 Tax=uncultured Thiothrix sp. TaxID=223185 RepID=UPI0026386598|nr:S1-like domain-containing RNA-binding protein [uncultured Thiothrix sp.]HMT94665.1 S1-like domain-containing RNA-binding protein [Thiolinea sp.]
MLKIGQFNSLRLTRLADAGVYLDAGSYGEILLPRRYVPANARPESMLEVFVYLDSEDRLIATTERPHLQVGECAYLKAVDSSRHGAFFDWGLTKDLLVPYNEQERPIEVGKFYVVHAFLDERTESIVGTTQLAQHLNEFSYYFKPSQAVNLLIYARDEFGYRAVVNQTHLGLLYQNEVFQNLRIGDQVSGYIQQIRPDRKIDLTLRKPGVVVEDALAQQILVHLKQCGGSSNFTDKTPPEQIYAEFKVSKAHFKRALGLLYKQKLIQLTPEKTTLL